MQKKRICNQHPISIVEWSAEMTSTRQAEMRGGPKFEPKKGPGLKRPHTLAMPCLPTVHHQGLASRSTALVVRTVVREGLGVLLRGYDLFGKDGVSKLTLEQWGPE